MSSTVTEALERDSALSLDQAAVGCSFQVQSLEGPACRQLREIESGKGASQKDLTLTD